MKQCNMPRFKQENYDYDQYSHPQINSISIIYTISITVSISAIIKNMAPQKCVLENNPFFSSLPCLQGDGDSMTYTEFLLQHGGSH